MNLDQAARRAAEKTANPSCNASGCCCEKSIETHQRIIAAEFAPLQELLVEAERLLGRAVDRFECFKCDDDGACKEHDTVYTDIDKFLAAKENGNG